MTTEAEVREHRISVLVPTETFEAMRARSLREHRTVSQTVRMLVGAYLAEQENGRGDNNPGRRSHTEPRNPELKRGRDAV